MGMLNGSFEDVFNSTFPQTEKTECQRLTRVISIPVPEEYKQKYEAIQAETGQKFIETVRALIMAAIDKGQERIS
jgi:hypothetical protein